MADDRNNRSGGGGRGSGGIGQGRIDGVSPAPASPSSPAWISVLKAFNPFGPAVEAYAKTLAYRVEMRRLAVEAERISQQAQIIELAVERTYELKMEELRHRRIALERTFDLAEQQLAVLHLERMEVLKMASAANDKALQPGIPMEERELFKELAIEVTKQLPSFGQSAKQNLEVLVAALPAIAMPRALLADGGGKPGDDGD